MISEVGYEPQNVGMDILVSDDILESMGRTFKTVDYDQALDLTVRLGDGLPASASGPLY